MKSFWIGLGLAVLFAAGCGPTPVTRERREANAENFDLAAADRLLAREAGVAEKQGQEAAQSGLVVNEDVHLLAEGAVAPEETASEEPGDVQEEPAQEEEPAPAVPDEKAIQRALKNAGYYAGAIDGKIGPKTLAAIKGFQKDNDLAVDGKVGPKTWTVLKEAY